MLNILKADGTFNPLELMKLADADMSSPAEIHKAVA
jgi:oligoendopeptidase F